MQKREKFARSLSNIAMLLLASGFAAFFISRFMAVQAGSVYVKVNWPFATAFAFYLPPIAALLAFVAECLNPRIVTFLIMAGSVIFEYQALVYYVRHVHY